MTLSEIEKLAKEFSDARAILCDRVQALDEDLRSIKKEFIPGIKKAVASASEKKARLSAAIDQNPALFEDPRTVVAYGIKFGFMKQRGKIEWDDDSVVCKLIKKIFPDTWITYIKISEKPMKKALSTLPVTDLKKIGVSAEETSDAVFIQPVDSDVDKLVDALLKDEDSKE